MAAARNESAGGDAGPEAAGAASPALVAAIRRVLWPLVRLLVRRGLTFPWLVDLLKPLFVEAAEAEIAAESGRPTISRISVLSGVHRKDVSRRVKEFAADPAPPRVHTVGTEIVARWLSEARYLDASGTPRPLPRTHRGGGAESFAALAEAVSRDVRPRTILDELLRLGIVRVDDDSVHLLAQGFVPAAEFDARAFYFGESLHDHLATGANNLEGRAPPMLERSVYYDELSPASVAKLAARSEELGMQLLTTINRDGMALEASDPPRPGERRRIRLGVFFYSAPVPSASADERQPHSDSVRSES
jgi:Family of unknown function (DUF6502)